MKLNVITRYILPCSEKNAISKYEKSRIKKGIRKWRKSKKKRFAAQQNQNVLLKMGSDSALKRRWSHVKRKYVDLELNLKNWFNVIEVNIPNPFIKAQFHVFCNESLQQVYFRKTSVNVVHQKSERSKRKLHSFYSLF